MRKIFALSTLLFAFSLPILAGDMPNGIVSPPPPPPLTATEVNESHELLAPGDMPNGIAGMTVEGFINLIQTLPLGV